MCKTIDIIVESLAFCHSHREVFLVLRGLASGRPRQPACPAISGLAGLDLPESHPGLCDCAAACADWRDSLPHAFPQRRPAELALSVRLPGASSPAAFLPTEHRVLPNGGWESEEEAAQCPPSRQADSVDRTAAARLRSAGNVVQRARQRAITRDRRTAGGRGGARRIEFGEVADIAVRADGRVPDRRHRTHLP